MLVLLSWPPPRAIRLHADSNPLPALQHITLTPTNPSSYAGNPLPGSCCFGVYFGGALSWRCRHIMFPGGEFRENMTTHHSLEILRSHQQAARYFVDFSFCFPHSSCFLSHLYSSTSSISVFLIFAAPEAADPALDPHDIVGRL